MNDTNDEFIKEYGQALFDRIFENVSSQMGYDECDNDILVTFHDLGCSFGIAIVTFKHKLLVVYFSCNPITGSIISKFHTIKLQ